MNGMNELLTIAKYRDRWADQRLVILVLHNNDLNQVTWEQRAMEGDPRVQASQALPDFPYARYAELVGLTGVRVDHPEAVEGAWREVLSSDRPAVLEAVTDPNVPPLPPHITMAQAKAFASSVLRGDPDARAMIAQAGRGKLAEFLHRG
jgi:pyruvate dehydrogenase (quinone)